MRYQKSCRDKGSILVDILTALSLGAVFIMAISSVSMESRDIYERAKDKNMLLDMFERGEYAVEESLFGNDLFEIDMRAATGTPPDELSIVGVDVGHENGFLKSGTPICSIDFESQGPIGSFEYREKKEGNLIHEESEPLFTPITLPIDPLLPLTDLLVKNGIAYITADSNVSSDPDLLIFDLRVRSQPELVLAKDTGPGLAGLALAGKNIFAAAASSAYELHAIGLQSLQSALILNRFRLPPPYATATLPYGSSIFYSDHKAYLGTEKWDGSEFVILDVSNSGIPDVIGEFEIGSKVNDIYVKDGYAYVSASDNEQLLVLDTRDPSHVTLMRSFEPSGWERQVGKLSSFFEDSLSFGRNNGGFNVTLDHEAFVWATSSALTLTNPISIDMPGGVYGMVSDRYHTYVASRELDKEFQIFDREMSSNSRRAYALPAAPQTMTCDNDRLYILANTAPMIYEIAFP